MTVSDRPILSLEPSTQPTLNVFMKGSPAEFTVVENPYVKLHLGKTSMGIQLKSRHGDSGWISICFIDSLSNNLIGILNPTDARIYPKENM